MVKTVFPLSTALVHRWLKANCAARKGGGKLLLDECETRTSEESLLDQAKGPSISHSGPRGASRNTSDNPTPAPFATPLLLTGFLYNTAVCIIMADVQPRWTFPVNWDGHPPAGQTLIIRFAFHGHILIMWSKKKNGKKKVWYVFWMPLAAFLRPRKALICSAVNQRTYFFIFILHLTSTSSKGSCIK